MAIFSFYRFGAVVAKEFVQMRRDRLTFAMMVAIPLIQLVLFGYAINSDPRHMGTVLLAADNSIFSRDIVEALRVSTYFDMVHTAATRQEMQAVLREGRAQFGVTIPEGFGRRLLRGERPVLLLEADATDPAATSNAMNAVSEAVRRGLARDLTGPLAHLAVEQTQPVEVRVHADYNPEAITQYNVVPGLLGIIQTMTLVIITGLAITRERERGTMEHLLTTPVRPLEVMLGKIVPFILVGYIQMTLILVAAKLLFQVPMIGNVALVYVLSLVFIAANLAVGLTFSTIASNQLQAMQLSIFFFLPSMLLSGFMFPFRGMPGWAQALGNLLPLTHYLRLVRGILLKGYTLPETVPHLWPIGLFFLVVITIGLIRYRQTLD